MAGGHSLMMTGLEEQAGGLHSKAVLQIIAPPLLPAGAARIALQAPGLSLEVDSAAGSGHFQCGA